MFPIRHRDPEGNLNHLRTLVTSLVYRFQKAGWIHGVDAFQGHVLRQPGPLGDWPVIRRMINVSARDGWGTDWSYRLVGFPDSVEVHNTEDGREVERSMKKMLEERKRIQRWVLGEEK